MMLLRSTKILFFSVVALATFTISLLQRHASGLPPSIAKLAPAADRLQDKQVRHTVLWSWERPDDLSFVEPDRVSVAYFAGTIILGRDNATWQKRKNPLKLKDGTVSFPAFRIENSHPDEPISDDTVRQTVAIITNYAAQKPCAVVQIDFDATAGERKQYLHLLQELRRQLPKGTPISITCLASWCLFDKWLKPAPVDETIAMMFSLGKEKDETLKALHKIPLDSGASAQQSLGMSINEPATNERLAQADCVNGAHRVYVFSSLGWSKSRYERIMAELDKK